MNTEVTPEIIEHLDLVLEGHKRVYCETDAVKWTNESNIYWNNAMFDLFDYGIGQIDMTDHPNRGLFWVKLQSKENPGVVIFASTAHFPWSGSAQETEFYMNQRIPCCLKVAELLKHALLIDPRISSVIFAGDFNDDFHPIRVLYQQSQLMDVFEALDMPPPMTHPVRPSDPEEEKRPNRTIDWITFMENKGCTPLGAFVKPVRSNPQGGWVPPSDHMPVIAFFDFFPDLKPTTL